MAKCDRCDRTVDRCDLKQLRSWYETDKVKDICEPCEKKLDALLLVQGKRNKKEVQDFLDQVKSEKRFVPLFTRLRRIW